jgi:hypothetical protein
MLALGWANQRGFIWRLTPSGVQIITGRKVSDSFVSERPVNALRRRHEVESGLNVLPDYDVPMAALGWKANSTVGFWGALGNDIVVARSVISSPGY